VFSPGLIIHVLSFLMGNYFAKNSCIPAFCLSPGII
jgi:hypothetical protein